jgi:hypothetical protein
VREQSLDDLMSAGGCAAAAGYLSTIFWQIRLINGQWKHRNFETVRPAIEGLAASDTNFSDTYRRTVPAECEWGANADKSGEENKKEQARGG